MVGWARMSVVLFLDIKSRTSLSLPVFAERSGAQDESPVLWPLSQGQARLHAGLARGRYRSAAQWTVPRSGSGVTGCPGGSSGMISLRRRCQACPQLALPGKAEAPGSLVLLHRDRLYDQCCMKGYENQAVKILPAHGERNAPTPALNQSSVPKGEQGPCPNHPG